MLHHRLALVALLALLALDWAQGAQQVRGVDPAESHLYVPDAHGKFTCKDGSASIPFSQVNDNYCDCPGDGSDEPGTSACYYGKFYCANRGHQPQVLSTSFVDDGICDCCDGSDESKVVCKNTCLEKGAAERQLVRDKVEQMKSSLDTKQQLIEAGRQRKAAWPGRSVAISKEVEAAQKAVDDLEDAKAQAKAAAEEDRQRIASEREAELKAAAEAHAAHEAEQQQKEQAAAAEGGQAAESAPAADVASEEQVEETDEERGRRIASQWTHDPEAATVPAEGGDEVTEGEHGYHEVEGDEEGDVGHEEDFDSHMDEDYGAHSSTHVDPNNVWSPLESKVHELDSQLSEAKRKLQELEEELEVITRYHGTGTKYDFGPDDMFAGLAGRCLADTGTRWTYEACFFDRAIQKEPHNPNNKVSLGTWHGWAKDYTEAVFANGDACAGAPARSLTVRLVCGDEERMYGGEEPATCVYTVTMTTPLACRQHDLQKELDKLAELERFEAEVRAEIEASEKARRSKDHSEL